LKYYYPGSLAMLVQRRIRQKFTLHRLEVHHPQVQLLCFQISLAGATKRPVKQRGSGYIDLSANYDLGNGWGVQAHVGHQDVRNYSDASYTDWKLGVTKDVGFGVVGLAYTDTNANTCGDCFAGSLDKNVGKARRPVFQQDLLSKLKTSPPLHRPALAGEKDST
jgi:uncharacterized protein (TIGR02001 family)